MFGYPCGPQPTMMIPVMPPMKRHAPCPEDDGTTKITAQMAAEFLEKFKKEGDCKVVNAEINGQEYKIKLTSKNKKKKKNNCSDSSDPSSNKSECKKGPKVKLCDCNVPMPPNVCDSDDISNKKATEREERMNKSLALCIKMMRELFVKEYNEQQEEDDGTVRMVEIPVMAVPGGMPGMGMGTPGMGMGMPGMRMGMPGMGMGMPGMGMSMPGMGMGMPGMGMGMPGMGMPSGMGMPGMGMPSGMSMPGMCMPPGMGMPGMGMTPGMSMPGGCNHCG